MNTSYSFVRQAGPYDCGPACLAAVAHAHGIAFDPASLPSAPVGGVSLFELARDAESIGLRAHGVQMSIRDLQGVSLPAIAHLDFGDGPVGRGHYVVVHALCKEGLTVADPAQGVRFMPWEVFARAWSRKLLLLCPRSEPIRRAAIGPLENEFQPAV